MPFRSPRIQWTAAPNHSDADVEERRGLLTSKHSEQSRAEHTTYRCRYSCVSCLVLCIAVLSLLWWSSSDLARSDQVQFALKHVQRAMSSATEVHRLEAELSQQRQQLLSLQNAVLEQPEASGTRRLKPCVDRWELKYPAEVDMWNGHSCHWKKTWGQCGEFKRQCARTCEACPKDSISQPHNATNDNQGGSDDAPESKVATEEEDDDDSVSPPPSPRHTATIMAEPLSISNGARSQQEALQRVLQDRERQQHAAFQPDLPASQRQQSTEPHATTGVRVVPMQDVKVVPSQDVQVVPVQEMEVQRHHTEGAGDDDDDAQKVGASDDDASASNGEIKADGTSTIDDSYEPPQSKPGKRTERIPISSPQHMPAPSRENAAAKKPLGLDITSDRNHYVNGDEHSVVSPGSECGIPTSHPAVTVPGFTMAAVRELLHMDPKGRQYSETT